MEKTRKKISKKTKILGLSLLAFVSTVSGFYLLNKEEGDVLSWMDSNWLYRRSIDVNNSQGSTLVNEEVLIEVDTASLISAGKLQNDCDDLRFMDSDDSTSLTYWVEGECNTAYTQVWLQIPSLPSEGKTIYMYYGNVSAANAEAAWSGNFINLNANASCDSGWTRNSNFDDKFAKGSDTLGTTGGSSSAHGHNDISITFDNCSSTSRLAVNEDWYWASPTHTHTATAEINDSTTTTLPPYYDMPYCQSSNLSISTNSVLIYTSLPSSGWTRFSALDSNFPRSSSSYATTGGAATHTHTSVATTTSTAPQTTYTNLAGSNTAFTHRSHNHALDSHTSTGGSNLPPYVDVIFAKPSGSGEVTPGEAITSVSAVPPLGWTRYTAFDNKYLRGASSYGATGGSLTHDHSFTFTTGTSSSSTTSTGGSNNLACNPHTHTTTESTNSVTMEPPYYTVLYAQKNVSETVTINTEETEDSVRGWSKGDYSYNSTITVNNSQGTTLTDEHVLIELNTSNMITSGRLQADCDDLRFLDPTNSSESLDYWIEGGCNTSNTQIWVKIPSLPTEGKTIEMYYGNPAATSGELSWSGDVYIYSDQSCPSGWTRVTAADDRFLYGSSTAGQTGGSATHTHTDISCTSDTISTTNIAGLSSGSNSGSTATHAHDNLQASFDTVSNLPPYSTMVLCSKPSFTLPANAVSIFNSLPGTNWTRYADLDDVFPMGKDSAGTTGGSSTHTHTLTTELATGTASTSESNGQVTSSGGTVTYDGNYKIHTFTSNGTFTIDAGVTAEYLIVGGGGSGGTDVAGGGGAGGVIHKTGQSISANSYSIVVGSGGATYATGGINDQGNPGGNSSFNGDTAIGGGQEAGNGGSGGGGGDAITSGGSGTAGQGYDGGNGISGGSSTYWVGGGGGGAGAAGGAASYSNGGHGGAGYTSTISGSSYIYAGGGGGGYLKSNGGAGTGQTGLGGSGVGGNGGVSSGSTTIVAATSPTTYGSGGGGGAWQVGSNQGATAGYQGVVIIKFPNTSESGTMASDTHTHTATNGTNSTESNVPPYMDVIFGESTTEAYIPDNIILPVTELPPLGWDRVTTMDNKFTKGSTSYGTTGGSSTHTHDVTIETGAPSATLSAYGSGVNFADSTHTHSCNNEVSSTESSLPPYLSVIYTERKTSETTTLDINTPPSKPTELQYTGASPSYSAIFTDLDPSDTGSAYQIQVNTESDFTGTMMWDSTKTTFGTPVTNGERTPDIAHAGTPLDISTMYHWRIKLWDDGNEEGEWSDPQILSMSDSPVAPTSLLTDGQINPTLLDDPYPHFSSIYEDTNSQDATAYEIEINTQSDFLGTVMWDSDKQPITITSGNRSTNIQYEGTPLSNTKNTLYWRIRYWDLDDNASEWSETATFVDYYPSLMFEGMSLEGISLN